MARTYGMTSSFPMDASRSDPAYLCEVIEAVIAAVPNDQYSRYGMPPQEFGGLIKRIKDTVSNSGQAIISVHCHNDLGMAVANSLAVVVAGPGRWSAPSTVSANEPATPRWKKSVMGLPDTQIGNRYQGRDGGNRQNQPVGEQDHRHGHSAEQGYRRSQCVLPIPRASIRMDCLKDKTTYEIMRPESRRVGAGQVGDGQTVRTPCVPSTLGELGYKLSEEEVNHAFERFKRLDQTRSGDLRRRPRGHHLRRSGQDVRSA